MDRRIPIESYQLYQIPHTIIAGECVMMMHAPEDPVGKKYVARIESITVDEENIRDVRVHVRWYYHPEETRQGRKEYHGERELIWSDHYDVQLPGCIEDICHVHSLDDYLSRPNIRYNDFFSRFEYDHRRQVVRPNPSTFPTYCICRQPNNPDRPMVKCDDCGDWFHFDCIGMNRQQIAHDYLDCSRHEQLDRMRRRGGGGGDGI